MFRHLSRSLKRFWAAVALLSLEMIIILVVFAVSLMAFFVIVRRIFLLKNEELDNRVFEAIAPYVNQTNTAVMNFITFFGTHEFLIPANLLLIAYYLFLKKHKWYSITIPAVGISSMLLMFGLKHLFGRERPENQLLKEATNFSFPSGHALMSVTFYGLLVYVVWHSVKNRTWRWVLIIALIAWTLIIGFTRIYLRRHYYSDVVAGYCIGFLWLVFAVWMLNRLEKYSRRKFNKTVEQPPVPSTSNA